MTYQIHFQAVDNGVASWMLAGLPPLPGHALWRNAMLSVPLENLVLVLRPMLPEDFAKHLKYR